ncbi:hypothetical protein P7C73_g6390, partial [Tremellales sp. Uapishka_1]
MSTAKAIKRKASVTQKQLKRPKAASPSPEFEDLENEAGPSTPNDPMIDPTDSSGSDEDDDDDGPDGNNDGIVEEEWTGIAEDDEDEAVAQGPAATKGKPSKKGLYKPPTLQEMDKLREIEEKGGNTFSLQLEALLASTLLPTTPHPALKSFLSTIHSTILSLPSLPGVSPKAAAKRTPMTFVGPDEFSPLGKEEPKWTLGWEKPQDVM